MEGAATIEAGVCIKGPEKLSKLQVHSRSTSPALTWENPSPASLGGTSVASSDAGNSPGALKKKVVIFEVAGGTDKGPDGHRRDTMPIVRSLESRGWEAEVVFYSDARRDEILDHVASSADAYMMRVNPGAYEGFTDSVFMDMGRELHRRGCLALQHPDTMLTYDPKDSLYKLRNLPVGMPDTCCYYKISELKEQFPRNIAKSNRVLKQNRGCTGEGIWVVKPHGWQRCDDLTELALDALVACTEMTDNSQRIMKLEDFMDMCRQYTEGDNGLVVDQRFLPRIVEGEVRVLMIVDTPALLIHKVPPQGQMSATLFSGARYTSYSPEDPKYQGLMEQWKASLPQVKKLLGDKEYPLIWCADFIVDTGDDGNDIYRLGELNASCVGFSTDLHVSEIVADSVVRMATAARNARAAGL